MKICQHYLMTLARYASMMAMSPISLYEKLIQLHLEPNEAKVYVALMELGPSHVGPLVKKTKLHRMLVYQALDRLQDRRLVTEMQKQNKKFFQAADASILLEEAKHTQVLTEDVVAQLHLLQQHADKQLDINILYGHEGFVSNLATTVQLAAKHDRILRILGGAQGDLFYEAIGGWYESYVKLLKRHQVSKWQISPASNSEAFKNKFARESNTRLKTMQFGLASPIQTRITRKMISIEIYTSQIVVIQMYNKTVAEGYLDYFELLWKQAKLYKPTK